MNFLCSYITLISFNYTHVNSPKEQLLLFNSHRKVQTVKLQGRQFIVPLYSHSLLIAWFTGSKVIPCETRVQFVCSFRFHHDEWKLWSGFSPFRCHHSRRGDVTVRFKTLGFVLNFIAIFFESQRARLFLRPFLRLALFVRERYNFRELLKAALDRRARKLFLTTQQSRELPPRH